MDFGLKRVYIWIASILIRGLDWQISRNWRLGLVFPVNMALLYSFSHNWKVGVAGRFFDSRFRVHHHDYSPKPLVRYTNMGAEFIIKYDNDTISANLHAGTTLRGEISCRKS